MIIISKVHTDAETGAVPLPKMLAQYGVVKMSRTKIMKIIGNLYKLRMNVNLISNVLGNLFSIAYFINRYS